MDRLREIEEALTKLVIEKNDILASAGIHICLDCGEPITEKDKDGKIIMVRGCHQRCNQRQRRDIKDGLITEEYLVRTGRRAPANPGGRPRVKRSYEHKIKQELREELKQQDQRRKKKS